MRTDNHFVALNRFGLGAGPSDAALSNPADWLTNQLRNPARLPDAGLIDGAAATEQIRAARRDGPGGIQRLVSRDGAARQAYRKAAARREAFAVTTSTPFAERLVRFWSNHFAVSVRKPLLLGLAEPFEREAIRPNIAGSFADMLLAAIRHPAMLVYLDNLNSAGPSSVAAQRRRAGLNENLARELLELHTLGVGGGYGQSDVEAMARMLTGWSVDRDGAGRFRFYEPMHEPGTQSLLGKRYPDVGERQAESAIRDLARHPSTARHLATKLARHFIADDPPEALVARLAKAYLDGDLPALYAALLAAPEAWETAPAKVKSPAELVVSALRATAIRPREDAMLRAANLLGQLPFSPPSPAGWPDRAADWIGAQAMLDRIEWCVALAERTASAMPPDELAAAVLGPSLSKGTSMAIRQAPSARDGLALLLASPEFQRR